MVQQQLVNNMERLLLGLMQYTYMHMHAVYAEKKRTIMQAGNVGATAVVGRGHAIQHASFSSVCCYCCYHRGRNRSRSCRRKFNIYNWS